MNRNLSLILALLLVGQVCSHAQVLRREILEPQALRLQISDVSFGIRAEGEYEQTKYLGDGGTKSTYQREFLGPVLGLSAVGSVYHPYFMTFNFSGEISPGYGIEKFDPDNFGGKQNQVLYLGDYVANFNFLSQKPYRFGASLSQNYSYRDYDFFNRVEVNTLRYGGNFGYQAGPVPFSVNVWHRNEQIYGQLEDSSLNETGLTLEAHNTRNSGGTTFNYTYDNTNRGDVNAIADNTSHAVALADTESFGRNKQILLTTTAGFSTQESANSPTDEMNASANLSIEHSPTVSSIYDLNYSRTKSSSSVGSTETSNLNGGVSLRHQLYESLTSTLRIQGQDFSSDGSFEDANNLNTISQTENSRLSGSVSEQYVKRLGSIGRLSMLGSIILEHSRVDNGGDTLIITDESHGFASSESTGSDSFFLNLPYVEQSTIVVTDSHNSFPAYQEGRDYTISNNGSLTMIRRAATTTIPQTATVLVDYRAKSTGSGEYDTITSVFNMRIDLWKGLLSVYGRTSTVQNDNAPPGLVLQDMDVQAIGFESSWRWIHVGAEFESNDSTFSSYRNSRFFQGFSFRPDSLSTLNIDFSESKTEYDNPSGGSPASTRDEKNYSLMTRYQRLFSRSFGFHLDAGVSLREGVGVDQTLVTVRPGLEFYIGQIAVKAGYNFEYRKFLESEEHMKQTLFISARRTF